MGKSSRKPAGAHEVKPVSLGELIHQHVRIAIETAVHEELLATLGATPYERCEARRGYRNGTKERTLTGPSGPVALTLPRATLFRPAGATEWTSTILPRYQRRMREVTEAVAATYLAGGNTRRIRGALQPLLKAAPLSKSAVSRVVATLKEGLEAWRTRALADLDVIYVYLDGFALRVRRAGKVVSAPVLGVVGVLPDGGKHLLALELCGGESCGVERLPRRSRRPGPPGPGAVHHRRQCRAAARRRAGVASGRGATLLRAQAAEPCM